MQNINEAFYSEDIFVIQLCMLQLGESYAFSPWLNLQVTIKDIF